MEGRLQPDDIEAIARRVVELLREAKVPADPSLLTVAEVAARFGVSRGFVYEHAAKLGVIRLGDGPKPPLRFDASRVAEMLTPAEVGPPQLRRRRRRVRRPATTTPSGVPLLSIRGDPVGGG
jgi:hypothetical protein